MQCVYPCSSCSPSDPTVCLSCVAGYTYNASSLQNCVANLTCTNNNNCVFCPYTYSLSASNNQQTCVSCAAGSNCARCLPNTPSVCTSCQWGYYLTNQQVCAACPDACGSCITASICITCAWGYVANMPATTLTNSVLSPRLTDQVAPSMVNPQPVGCTACSSPCMSCMISPTTCLSCVTNYTLYGTTCISNFQFTANVVLQATAGVFTSNYYQFLLAVATAIAQQTNTILIQSIVYSSSDITMAIATNFAPGSTQAQNQQSNLNSVLR